MKKEIVEETLLVEPEFDFDIDAEKVPVIIASNIPKVEREYRRISNKLGTAFAEPLHTTDLVKYLAGNSMTVYPMEKVRIFLNKKLKSLPKVKQGRWDSPAKWTWNWLALRDQDVLKKTGNFSKLYAGSKPVPLEVLMTVEKIADDLGPTRVHFYVSDFVKAERPTPRLVDPFLAVCVNTTKLFVIERWDEPAFRS
jgi:hypothetical protein